MLELNRRKPPGASLSESREKSATMPTLFVRCDLRLRPNKPRSATAILQSICLPSSSALFRLTPSSLTISQLLSSPPNFRGISQLSYSPASFRRTGPAPIDPNLSLDWPVSFVTGPTKYGNFRGLNKNVSSRLPFCLGFGDRI